jgi:dienelactone hydrolase
LDVNDAKRLMGRVEAIEIGQKWLQSLKSQEMVNGKLATIGWFFGGGWALSAATAKPVDATVFSGQLSNRRTTASQRTSHGSFRNARHVDLPRHGHAIRIGHAEGTETRD